jgi:hypothetical protein
MFKCCRTSSNIPQWLGRYYSSLNQYLVDRDVLQVRVLEPDSCYARDQRHEWVLE